MNPCSLHALSGEEQRAAGGADIEGIHIQLGDAANATQRDRRRDEQDAHNGAAEMEMVESPHPR